MNYILYNCFLNILTPAVAGNILWSFGAIFFDDSVHILQSIPYIVVMAILSFYLLHDYFQVMVTSAEMFTPLMAVFELLHLTFIALTVLAIGKNSDAVYALILGYILVIILGNCIGAWMINPRSSWKTLVAVDVIGVLILLFGYNILYDWCIPASLILSLGYWIVRARPFSYRDIEGYLRNKVRDG